MCLRNFAFQFVILWNIHGSLQREATVNVLREEKAVYKAGEEIRDMLPITLENIKKKLNDTGIFDSERIDLTPTEQKELKKMFDVVQIMTGSRNRQPSNVQTMFSSLRMVERVLKKQMKEGQISESLASKFNWEKMRRIKKQVSNPRNANINNNADNNLPKRDFFIIKQAGYHTIIAPARYFNYTPAKYAVKCLFPNCPYLT